MIGAAALTVAGLYQFSALKHRCLEHCRSPFSFMLEAWGDDLKRRALSIGTRHGLFCVGCCWSLMLLMLPLGASRLRLDAAARRRHGHGEERVVG